MKNYVLGQHMVSETAQGKDTSAASYGTILLNFVLAMIYGYIATCL